jgi:hypothetical protein
MFKRLAKSGLAGFRLVQSRRTAPGPGEAVMHSNDNLPGLRRPKGRRRIPTPALACHWINRNGRLECRWHLDINDTPSGGVDAHQHSAPGRACGRSTPQSRNLALAG